MTYTSNNCSADVRPARASVNPLVRLMDLVAMRRQRRQLARLDAHLLRDIGLTAQEASDEAARPAWDAPAHWRG